MDRTKEKEKKKKRKQKKRKKKKEERKKQTHVNTSASAWSIYGTRVRNPARMSDFVIHMTKFDAAAIAARRI